MRALDRTRKGLLTPQAGQLRTRLTTTLIALAVVAGLGAAGLAVTRDQGRAVLAAGSNPVTPGSFTGYGFDQCLAPTQAKMDAWLEHSPFLSVGIYISGNSRACRSQPNLTPTWVSNQLRKGWKLLPITLGPQSPCVGRYPRYGASIDPTISTNPANSWGAARTQARAEAERAVSVATSLGIVPGSTLFYDLEGWSDYTHATCRESALAFLSAWTRKVRALGYVSGVYSSAGSGMRILDQARSQGRADVALPDQIWLARYDKVANTSATQYLSDAGWQGQRIKQYMGGHDETWGGVTINIDRNYLHIGGGSRASRETHCGGVPVDFSRYPALAPGVTRTEVRTLKCLLVEQGITGVNVSSAYYGRGLAKGINTWLLREGFQSTTSWRAGHWKGLLPRGGSGIQKFGSSGAPVWRLQRALVARGYAVPLSGVLDATTVARVRDYQTARGLKATGIVTPTVWSKLYRGL